MQQPAPTNAPATSGEVIAITGVKANPSNKGVEIILETSQGAKLQVVNRSAGNNFIADITGGQLRLANGDAFTFQSEKPSEGIRQITVTNIDANTVRVTVVGEKALPAIELFDDNAGLVFAVASTATTAQTGQTPQTQEKPAGEKPAEKPAAQQNEPIELVVTGERDGYNVPNASTATRTDTPLRDIPQAIQVVPRQVIEDRGVRREIEALETVSGVFATDTRKIYAGSNPGIRGFLQYNRLRNGLRGEGRDTFLPIGGIEQIEVLKGPASVLFGALEPGGVVNIVTRQPSTEPYYKIGLELGNYGFYQPSIDVSGSLTQDKNVLYRLIAAYQGGGSYKDYTSIEDQIVSIAPSVTFRLGDRTNLNLYYEYGGINAGDLQEPILSNGGLIPRDVNAYYLSSSSNHNNKAGYTFTHEFNDSLQLRNSFAATFSNLRHKAIEWGSVLEDRFLADYYAYSFIDSKDRYFGLIDLVGKFKTGSISHQLVAGFDFQRDVARFGSIFNQTDLPPLDIFNPNYNISLPEIQSSPVQTIGIDQSYGVYLQDQIAFSDNLKMLIGGRYDWISNENGPIDGDQTSQSDGAFSPRIGLVYQPRKNVSLYTSYSQSFLPSIGRNPDNKPFKPTEGTQYEVGVKADFLDGRLSTTLAAYVRNLFDIDYVSNSSFGTLYVDRGKPLTITGSISWEF